MSSEGKFELRMEGLDPAKLVKIQGEHGPFYTCISGSDPGLKNGLFYGDNRYQFCFFTRYIFDRSSGKNPEPYDLEVYDATVQRLRGTLVNVPNADAEYLERNIAHLLRTREVTMPSKPVNPNDAPREIRFTWRITR
jgi:hypothetical protein